MPDRLLPDPFDGSDNALAPDPPVAVPGPADPVVSPADTRDLMGELTALADAFYRVVEYLRTPTPTITESEAAEIADAALFRAEEVIDRGR